MWKIQKGYESVSKSFRLPVELVEELDQLAYENNLSLNQLVIQCLRFALENLDNEDSKKTYSGHNKICELIPTKLRKTSATPL